MNYTQTLFVFYPNKYYYCEDTYESIIWNEDETFIKPTDEHLKELWETISYEYYKEIMRQRRDMLLNQTDYKMVSDFPHQVGHREAWETYRQLLRDLPTNWTIETEFPTPPE